MGGAPAGVGGSRKSERDIRERTYHAIHDSESERWCANVKKRANKSTWRALGEVDDSEKRAGAMRTLS